MTALKVLAFDDPSLPNPRDGSFFTPGLLPFASLPVNGLTTLTALATLFMTSSFKETEQELLSRHYKSVV